MRAAIRLQRLHSVSLIRTTSLNPYSWLPLLRSRQCDSQRYLWSGQKRSTDDSKSQSDTHMTPGTETSESKLFATGSSLATRMSTDRKFQCTQFDKKGEIFMGHGHIQRSELVSTVSVVLLCKRREPQTDDAAVRYIST